MDRKQRMPAGIGLWFGNCWLPGCQGEVKLISGEREGAQSLSLSARDKVSIYWNKILPRGNYELRIKCRASQNSRYVFKVMGLGDKQGWLYERILQEDQKGTGAPVEFRIRLSSQFFAPAKIFRIMLVLYNGCILVDNVELRPY